MRRMRRSREVKRNRPEAKRRENRRERERERRKESRLRRSSMSDDEEGGQPSGETLPTAATKVPEKLE